jgi:uncharacterized protein YciI
VKLDGYTVVFLRRPPDAPNLPEEELTSLQEKHTAFHAKMREEGHVVFNGPLSGQPDESLRGITVYRTSVEEARRLAGQDPAVQAGVLGDRPASTLEAN